MKHFHHLVFFLLTLLGFAAAQGYGTTVYITSTVTRINTVHKKPTPAPSAANSTVALPTSVGTLLPYPSKNGTGPVGTGTGTGTGAPSATAPLPTFTGAASQLNANAFVAALAAGVGYLVL